MAIQPYLNFDGRSDEAAAFYKKALGAEVEMLMRFKDNPEPQSSECTMASPPDKVMHMCLKIGEDRIMASDGACKGQAKFEGISLTYTAANETDAKRVFGALGDGGNVQMPMAKTFFSPAFGMVADKFGVSWMVLVQPQHVAAAA